MERTESHRKAAPEDRFDSGVTTLALGNAPAVQPRPAQPVLVLSEDAMLLDAMAAAVLDLAATIVSPSADRFVDQLVANNVELVLIDTSAAPQDLADFLMSLRRQFPQLQMLVAGPGTMQHLIGSQIADGTVFRFAHKPASAQRLRLFVDAALRERQARITQQIVSTSLPGAVAAARADTKHSRPWRMIMSLAFVLTVIAAGLVAWYGSRSDHRTTRAQSSEPAAEPAAAPTPPPENPAAATAAVPVIDMAAQAAAEQEAIDRAAAERSERSEKERIAAETEARQAALADQIRRAAKEDAQLALSSDQDKDRTLPDGAPASQTAPTSPPAKSLLSQDSATTRAPSATAPIVALAIEDQPMLAPVPAAELETSAASTAAPAKTRAPTAASPQTLPESALHRVTFVAPAYPPDALLHEQTGAVDLDFTVTPEGTVTDIQVTAADPRGVFEHASITALAHDRYEPVMRDGLPVAQRAHIRLRFTL